MRLHYLFLSASVLFSTLSFGQTPCVSNTQPPAASCAQACIRCDFTELTASTAGFAPQPAPGFCASIENNSWIGLVAGQDVLTVTITPQGCAQGVEAAIYADCNATAPLVCSAGGNTPFSLNLATVPGQNLLLMVDGKNGDDCTYTVTSTNAAAPMLQSTQPIAGAASICPGGTATYSVPAVDGASTYVWDAPPGSTINGMLPPVTLAASVGTTVQIKFPSAPSVGVFPICVQPFNACNDGTVFCKNVQIDKVETLLPTAYVCDENLPYILPWGDEVYSTGNYTDTLESSIGCDSIVKQLVIVEPPDSQGWLQIERICPGESFSLCGQTYTQAGQYFVDCGVNQNGCNIFWNLIIQVVNPISKIKGVADSICFHPGDTLPLFAEYISGQFYRWVRNDTVRSHNLEYLATEPGMYILQADLPKTGGTTCTATDTVWLIPTSLPPLEVVSQTSCTPPEATLSIVTPSPGSSFVWYDFAGQLVDTGSVIQVQTSDLYTVIRVDSTAPCTIVETYEVSLNPVFGLNQILGAGMICPGGYDTYQVPFTFGANEIIWTGSQGLLVNGMTPPVVLNNQQSMEVVQVQFPSSPMVSIATLCARAVGACADTALVCKNIAVSPPTPTILPNITVCAGDPIPPCPCPLQNNVCECTYPSSQGCDSTVRQFYIQKPPIFTALPPIFLCVGESFEVCGELFTQPGSYTKVCTSAEGCDSTVLFSIIINQVFAQISTASPSPGIVYAIDGDTICLTPNQPSLIVYASPSPGTFTWYFNGNLIGSGQSVTLTNPGELVLCVNNQFGAVACSDCDTLQVVAGQLIPGGGTITGPDTICGSEQFTLDIDPVAGVTEYLWQLPPGFTKVGSGTSINVNQNTPFPVTGDLQFCVTPADGCNEALKSCKTIHITEGIVELYFLDAVCRDSFQYVCGHWNYEQPLIHTHTNPMGCDTLVAIELFGTPILTQNLGVMTICAGDTLYLNGNAYTTQGSYVDTVYDAQTDCLLGHIVFTLRFANPVAHIENTLGGTNAICLSPNQQLVAADSADQFIWKDSTGHELAFGRFFSPFAPGVYILTASVLLGNGEFCTANDTVTVLAIDFQQHQVTQTVDCGSLTGTLTVAPYLSAQYTYTWLNASLDTIGSGQTIQIDTTGIYTVMVEANGCSAAFDSYINLSPAIQITLNWVTLYIDLDENCAVSAGDFKASNVYVHAEKLGGGGLTRVSDAQGRVQFPLTEGTYNISVGQQPISNGLLCPLQLVIPECSAGTVSDTAFLRMTVSAQEPVKHKSPQLNIAPNPATHAMQVSGAAFAEGAIVNWQIMNQLGQVVAAENHQTFPLSLRGLTLPDGMYHIRVAQQTEGFSAFGKLLITH